MIAALTGSILFGIMAIIYILLALGFPFGEFAMGGRSKVLSPKMRGLVAVSILIQILGILVLLQGGGVVNVGFPYQAVKVLCYVFAVYLSLNTVMNLFSKSKKEQIIVTPMAAIVAVCYWVTAINM